MYIEIMGRTGSEDLQPICQESHLRHADSKRIIQCWLLSVTSLSTQHYMVDCLMIRDTEKRGSYQTALHYLGPLQSHCDAVEKDEGQNHVVKELMGNNGLAEQSEPDRRETERVEERE